MSNPHCKDCKYNTPHGDLCNSPLNDGSDKFWSEPSTYCFKAKDEVD